MITPEQCQALAQQFRTDAQGMSRLAMRRCCATQPARSSPCQSSLRSFRKGNGFRSRDDESSLSAALYAEPP